jgi:hypothetical protein
MPASCSTCPNRHLVTHQTIDPRLECRALPPTPDPIQRFAVWPHVKPTDVCAAHPDFEPAPSADVDACATPAAAVEPDAAAQADLPL